VNKNNKIYLKNEKNARFFTLMELFCIKEAIISPTKRNFFQVASNIIDHKLSLEFQLRNYSDFEKLKLLILNPEQLEYLKTVPKFNLEKHINDFIDFRKTNL